MTSREIVWKTVSFQKPERLGWEIPEAYGSDFYYRTMRGYTDVLPSSGLDDWGCVWENLGNTSLGQVKENPLKEWSDLSKLKIPNMEDESRYENLKTARQDAGDKFLIAFGNSIYTRVCFLRGLENTWVDLYDNPEELKTLIQIMVDINLKSIVQYGKYGYDGFFLLDDWGLQYSLMISPAKWREFFKPAYAQVFQAAHKAGMLNFLHSCGYIVDILEDLIEIGLDVIQMDQQMNMGFHRLELFVGRICFFCPVDIQAVMPRNDPDEIRAYLREMVQRLGREDGGFMLRWYCHTQAVGHKPEAIDAMCREFMRLAWPESRRTLPV